MSLHFENISFCQKNDSDSITVPQTLELGACLDVLALEVNVLFNHAFSHLELPESVGSKPVL